MHGLKTPAFLGLRTSSRPASPAPNTSPPSMTPIVTPGSSAQPTPLDISIPVSPIDGPNNKDSIPLRRPLAAKLHLSSAFRRASPSPSPAPTPVPAPTIAGTSSSYLDALALKLSEAAGKTLASPTPAHNSDGLLIEGRRPLPAGRGRALGQLIVSEMNAALATGGCDLLRASLRAMHRPLNVLLSNMSGLLAPLVGALHPTGVLLPSNGWVGNGAAQAHALGLACMAGELLEALDGLPADCNKVGGEGLRSTKEGLEGVIKRVVNPVFAAVRTELGALIDALEVAPEPCAVGVGKKDKVVGDQPAIVALQTAMPCAMRVLTRVGTVPGPVVRGALAQTDIAMVWRAMVALAHRPVSASVPSGSGSPTRSSSGTGFLGKSHGPSKALSSSASTKTQTLGKTPSLGSMAASSSGSAVPASLTKRLTPPNTPPAGRFGLLLPPSRPSSPPGSISPAAQLAHDARVVVGLLDALPKPAGEDAREAVGEAFDALRTFAELLGLLSASVLDKQAIIDLVDGESADEASGKEEREELPALIVLPAVLRGKSVATLLDIPEAEYRERCLSGFGRAEASEEVVAKAVLRAWKEGESTEWVRAWLEGRSG
ncbi:hypothetical protein RhiLY_10477 [Ceratobasidium sp. AG-Ba]|nr:hypothetical protein RhiLY_10477 [Ceratobasidium sp. AG-Ba]